MPVWLTENALYSLKASTASGVIVGPDALGSFEHVNSDSHWHILFSLLPSVAASCMLFSDMVE